MVCYNECVLMDVSKVVPSLKEYNLVTMSMSAWNKLERQMRDLSSKERIAKLERSRKYLRNCMNNLQKGWCPTSKIAKYLRFKRLAVTAAIVIFMVMRLNNPKDYTVRKVVTLEGAKALKEWLLRYKKRWATISDQTGDVALLSDDPVFYSIHMCQCHPNIFETDIRPYLSVRKT